MARLARVKSKTGIYHVMLRGINHQTIFEDEEDFQKYLQTLKDYKEKLDYTIYAYCLMDNHIHLLMKEGETDLGKVFMTIGPSFVYWYNWKYGRSGNLFDGRYKSEVVEDDKYFMVVSRYIHQNPLKARIVEDVGDYKWSSYKEYIGKANLCDIDFGLDMISSNRSKAIEMFKEYNSKENQDTCLDFDQVIRLKDSEAREIIIKLAKIDSPSKVSHFDKERRTELVRNCRRLGMSIRQISRLTGISLGVVRGIGD